MNSHHSTKLPASGFTLIELIVIMAVIAIFAMMALPDRSAEVARAQIIDSEPLAKIAYNGVASYYAGSTPNALPTTNEVANVPAANKLVGSYVTSVTIRDGVVTMVFGNDSHGKLTGKRLTFRPAFERGVKGGGITWICGNQPVPSNMDVAGTNTTDVPNDALPTGIGKPLVGKPLVCR